MLPCLEHSRLGLGENSTLSVVSWKPLQIVRPQVGPSGCLHRQTLRPHQASTLVYEQFSRIWTLDLDMEKYERLGEDENHVILN